jgi:hypothetical protein
MTLLLTAQTTLTCERCRRNRATKRVVWEVTGHAPVQRDFCTACAPDAERWEAPSELVVMVTRVTLIPRICAVCGADRDPVTGDCAELTASLAETRRRFSCDCATCVIYGGDCYRVAQHEHAYAMVKEHRRAGQYLRAPIAGLVRLGS